MSGAVWRRGVVLALVVGVGATISCRSDSDLTPSTADGHGQRRGLLDVSVPELSRLEESVQAQVQSEYESLMDDLQDPDASVTVLANRFGGLGTTLMATENFDVAEPFYLNAQTLAPDDMRWPYYLGHLYRAVGSTRESVSAFERALQLKADDVATLVWLGEAHLADGRPEDAEPLFARALSLRDRSVAARAGLGRAALAREDYDAARHHLEHALALDSQAVSLHYPLALAYRGLGDEEMAEAHLELRGEFEVLPSDPLMDRLRHSLRSAMNLEIEGSRAFAEGDVQVAVQRFIEALAITPDSSSLRYKLGTALLTMGDARGAIEQFGRVAPGSPEHTESQFNLGMLFGASARTQEAIEQFSIVLRHEPDHADARIRLGTLLRRTGRSQESLSHFEHALEVNPGAPEAIAGYTMALVSLGRYRDARARLSRAVADHPGQPEFAHALARVLAAAPDDTVRDGQEALGVMQALPEEQRRLDLGETMAMVFAELGRFDEATTWQRNAMAAAARAGRDDLARRMAANLERYEAGRPCRTPWRPEDLP